MPFLADLVSRNPWSVTESYVSVSAKIIEPWRIVRWFQMPTVIIWYWASISLHRFSISLVIILLLLGIVSWIDPLALIWLDLTHTCVHIYKNVPCQSLVLAVLDMQFLPVRPLGRAEKPLINSWFLLYYHIYSIFLLWKYQIWVQSLTKKI